MMEHLELPGIKLAIDPEPTYNWEELGEILAEGFDNEQAVFLASLAAGLREPDVAAGLMQIEYLSAHIRECTGTTTEDANNIKWLLRELLERLEDA